MVLRSGRVRHRRDEHESSTRVSSPCSYRAISKNECYGRLNVVATTLDSRAISVIAIQPPPFFIYLFFVLGVVVVSVSSCRDASNHPLIDALEVYARPHGSEPPSPALAKASNTRGMSRVPEPIVEALSACSLLLGSALGLSLTAGESTSTNGNTGENSRNGAQRVEDDVLASINQSATSVLRNTCLPAEPMRWRDLRRASRVLLAVAMPDVDRRAAHVDRAYAEEARRALLGGAGSRIDSRADAFMGGGDRQVRVGASLSPVMLRRVAQLCRKVCTRRSDLLRDELAPALTSASPEAAVASQGADRGVDNNTAGGSGHEGQMQLASFVFPALVQRFWECCVWRRDGRESMEAVLFDVLRLAVHEMRAAGRAAALQAVTSVAVDSDDEADRKARASRVADKEKEVLRAGLGELVPLLQSDVARVAQATASQLTVLLLGPRPVGGTSTSSRATPSSTSRAAANRQSKARGEADGAPSPSRRVANGDPSTGSGSGPGNDNIALAPGAGGDVDAVRGEGGSNNEVQGSNRNGAGDGVGVGGAAVGGGQSGGGGGDDSGNNSASAAQLAMATLRALGSMEDRGPRTHQVGTKDDHGEDASSGGEGGAAGGAAPSADGADQVATDRAFDVVAAVSAAGAGLSDGSFPGQTVAPPSKRAKTSSSSAAGDSGRAEMDVAEGQESSSSPASASPAVIAHAVGAKAANATMSEATVPTTGSAGSGSASGAAPVVVAANPAAATATGASKICYRCDGCDDFPLQYVRHHCLVCADFDLCPTCYELFHGPNNDYQGGNGVMAGGHSTAHGMVALQVGWTTGLAWT